VGPGGVAGVKGRVATLAGALLVAFAGPAAAEEASPTAIFCILAGTVQPAEGKARKIYALNVLLPPAFVTEDRVVPDATFDPEGLLPSGKIDRFYMTDRVKMMQAGTSGSKGTPDFRLLSLTHRRDFEYDASLGTTRPEYMGRCFGYRSADAKDAFDQKNKEWRSMK